MRPGEECALIWDAVDELTPPAKLLNFTYQFAEVDLSSARYVEAPLRYFRTNRARLGVVIGRIQSNPSLTLTNAIAEP